ncbi:histidine phosphatase family protein [Phytoactinopolyspora limicola]|uniref:histidine phosphatase family protein n=1 Tax=Phytoactinopolyspora limicola TaxID=2715536 RepID=UPI00140D88F5|nr:histidine phosphatase family protein [Phytoactinopolyspora limicola]
MTSSTIVTLARHGRTPWHKGNRYTGSSDVDIDDVGRRQANQLAAWAAHERPSVLYASTLRRARQTARPVADVLGVPVHTDARLVELDFGAAEGTTLAELRTTHPEVVALFEADAAQHHLPGGEHPERAADRATAALTDIAARHPGEHVLVICHNTLIRLIVCRYLGVPMGRYRTVLRGLDPVATTRLLFSPDQPVMLQYYNRTPSTVPNEEVSGVQVT